MRRAAEGVLLIRNIDELAAEPQAQLLRYIRSFETSLSAEKQGAQPSPSQVICTARKPLRTQVLAAAFLPEIYYRLSAVTFSLPPLRDRKEDIPALVQMFIDAVSREQQRPLQGLGPGSLPILLRHLWPGNVRELESVVRAACLASEAQWLRPIDLVILPAGASRQQGWRTGPARELHPRWGDPAAYSAGAKAMRWQQSACRFQARHQQVHAVPHARSRHRVAYAADRSQAGRNGGIAQYRPPRLNLSVPNLGFAATRPCSPAPNVDTLRLDLDSCA